MKQSMFSKQGQKGFTLLELLIVVTIIAILSVGAIFAYEGLTEQAQSSAASSNTLSGDQAIRNYRAVTGNYPNQWDQLVAEDNTALDFVADETYRVLARIPTPASNAFTNAIIEALDEVGIEELQARTVGTIAAGVEPNLQHSEGAVNDGNTIEIELEEGDLPASMVIVPTTNGATGVACNYNGADPLDIRADVDGAINDDAAAMLAYMTQINDNLGEDECHLVMALGFGHDAAHSTVNSNAAIAAAPAFISNNINPGDNYARYIALFDVGFDGADGTSPDGNITDLEIFSKAKFIGLIDPEGRTIDENVAASNDKTVN